MYIAGCAITFVVYFHYQAQQLLDTVHCPDTLAYIAHYINEKLWNVVKGKYQSWSVQFSVLSTQQQNVNELFSVQ